MLVMPRDEKLLTQCAEMADELARLYSERASTYWKELRNIENKFAELERAFTVSGGDGAYRFTVDSSDALPVEQRNELQVRLDDACAERDAALEELDSTRHVLEGVCNERNELLEEQHSLKERCQGAVVKARRLEAELILLGQASKKSEILTLIKATYRQILVMPVSAYGSEYRTIVLTQLGRLINRIEDVTDDEKEANQGE